MMPRRMLDALLSPMILASCGLAASANAGTPPSVTLCRDALLKQIEQFQTALPAMTKSAEIAAKRLVSGGNFYAAGEESFVSENYIRAGGTMMVAELKDTIVLTEKDVVLVGVWSNANPRGYAACERAKKAGAYVVLFSPAAEEPLDESLQGELEAAGIATEPKAPITTLCDAHIAICEKAGQVLAPTPKGQTPALAAPLFGMTALWAYTGELVGALTREGKTLCMYQSVMSANARARNARYINREDLTKRRFHVDMTVPPQAPGAVGGAYLDAVRRMTLGLRGSILDQMEEAARIVADSVRAGGTIQTLTMSHFMSFEVKTDRMPPWLKADFERRITKTFGKPEQIAAAMKKGDVFFYLGYYELEPGYVEPFQKAGEKTIVLLCHAANVSLTGPQPDVLIDAQWEYGDACVLLPGYDVKILPSSGVLQTVIFWTILSEAENSLGAR